MRKEEIVQRIQALKRNTSKTSGEERLRQNKREVYRLMDLLVVQRIQPSGAAEAINRCYAGLSETPTDSGEARTDLLISIKVCLDIVKILKTTAE